MNKKKKNKNQSKLINFSPELIKEIERYKTKYYQPSFTAAVRELIVIGLGKREPRDKK